MSTDFQTLKECIEAKKGAFIGVCIKESDLDAGTSQNGDWTKKVFTLQDATADIEITVWNDDIKIFKLGNKYEFTGVYWKEYNQNWTANFGKYSNAKLIGTATEQTTLPEPQETVGDSLIKEGTTLPEMGGSFEEFTEQQCIQLLQIEKTVKKIMSKFAPTEMPSGQKVGMHTKEIYRESKKFKFEKASQS
jgi:hypothetical protein